MDEVVSSRQDFFQTCSGHLPSVKDYDPIVSLEMPLSPPADPPSPPLSPYCPLCSKSPGITRYFSHGFVENLVTVRVFNCSQCSQPSSPSVFGGVRDGLWLVVRLFGGARTDYAREGKDRTDCRGLSLRLFPNSTAF